MSSSVTSGASRQPAARGSIKVGHLRLAVGAAVTLLAVGLIWDGFATGAISGRVSPAFYGMFILVIGAGQILKGLAQLYTVDA